MRAREKVTLVVLFPPEHGQEEEELTITVAEKHDPDVIGMRVSPESDFGGAIVQKHKDGGIKAGDSLSYEARGHTWTVKVIEVRL